MESQELLTYASETEALSVDRAVGLNKLYLIPKKLSKQEDVVITAHFSVRGEEEYNFNVDFEIIDEGILKVEEISEEEEPGLFDITDYICSSERIKEAFIKTIGDRPVAADRLVKFLIVDELKDRLIKCEILKQEFIEFEVAGEPAIIDTFHVRDDKVESIRFLSHSNGEPTPKGAWEPYADYISYVSAIPGTDLFEFTVKIKGLDRCVDIAVGDTPDRLTITRFA